MIWLLFGAGVLLILVILVSAFAGFTSASWPTASGKVISAFVQTRKNKHSSSKTRYYHPIVNYEYHVNGKRFYSNRIGNFLAFGNNKKLANEIVSQFSAEKDIRVYYFPFFTRWSVLMPGMHQKLVHIILLITGIIIVLGAIPVLFTNNPYGFIDKLFDFIT
jgi:hypothetical protein